MWGLREFNTKVGLRITFQFSKTQERPTVKPINNKALRFDSDK